MRYVKHCAPPTPIVLWRARVLAFLGAALVGLMVPTGCVVGPHGGVPTPAAMQEYFLGPDGVRCNRHCDRCEATCGAPCDDCVSEIEAPCETPVPCETAACEPRPKLWHRLHFHRLHCYDPEAGIFNFCIPPQCLNPPPPLPPGRFFPVPVRPAFSQRGDAGYGLVGGFGAGSTCGNGTDCPAPQPGLPY
jgi:hypothetical protein